MAATSFKVESGAQLLARLVKKPEIENFYPHLFKSGPKYGEIIEIFSDISMSRLLIDVISEALIPVCLGGPEINILLFSSDGNLHYDYLVKCLQKKIFHRMNLNDECYFDESNNEELCNQLRKALNNLHILKIYDASQFYISLYNIEQILMEHSSISMIVFDTLTAFYWSEQGFNVTKMDSYIKSLLLLIHKITKDYKITIFYTRPEYFSSSKGTIESLESCSELPAGDKLNYRIQLLNSNDDEKTYQVNVRNYAIQYKKKIIAEKYKITWIDF